MQTGIEVLGVVENMSGLSQRLSAFNFLTTAPDGSQQDVTQQLLQHLPPHLQASARSCKTPAGSACSLGLPTYSISNMCCMLCGCSTRPVATALLLCCSFSWAEILTS